MVNEIESVEPYPLMIPCVRSECFFNTLSSDPLAPMGRWTECWPSTSKTSLTRESYSSPGPVSLGLNGVGVAGGVWEAQNCEELPKTLSIEFWDVRVGILLTLYDEVAQASLEVRPVSGVGRPLSHSLSTRENLRLLGLEYVSVVAFRGVVRGGIMDSAALVPPCLPSPAGGSPYLPPFSCELPAFQARHRRGDGAIAFPSVSLLRVSWLEKGDEDGDAVPNSERE